MSQQFFKERGREKEREKGRNNRITESLCSVVSEQSMYPASLCSNPDSLLAESQDLKERTACSGPGKNPEQDQVHSERELIALSNGAFVLQGNEETIVVIKDGTERTGKDVRSAKTGWHDNAGSTPHGFPILSFPHRLQRCLIFCDNEVCLTRS